LGIEEENKNIEQICSLDASPTFENTIIPFESSGETLTRATILMYNLLSANRSDQLEMIAEQLTPVLTKHENEIYQNKVLFSRIKSVKETCIFSTEEDKMLVRKIYDAFIDSGIALHEKDRVKFNKIKAELAHLKLLFSKNLVNETKAFQLIVNDSSCIEGLPDINVLQASEKAKEKGVDGWLFDLYAPSYIPFMTYVKDRNLRQEMYMAYNTKCIHDNGQNNLDICKRLVNLRREIAQLLGYKTYADYVLKHRMAGNVKSVYRLLNDLVDAYKPTALEERDELHKLFERQTSKVKGQKLTMEPWDTAFYSHKLKLKKYTGMDSSATGDSCGPSIKEKEEDS
jgi:peptidyl-dipeptidase Dcp